MTHELRGSDSGVCDRLNPEKTPDPEKKRFSLPQIPNQKRFKVIACEIVFRELCLLAAQSPHLIDVEFLRKGLHDAGKKTMCDTIQNAINQVDIKSYDAIILGYGRCNDGVVGLKAPDIPLIIPKAHDCITFFFGSHQAYQDYFAQFPGTYYRTSGWTERGNPGDDSVMAQLGLDRTYQEYVEKYGEDNAKFIMESLGNWVQNYEYLAYIEMGLPCDPGYCRLAQEEAESKQLQFRLLQGDMRLLRLLLEGQWNPEDFIIVNPGQTVLADNSGGILTAVTSYQQKD